MSPAFHEIGTVADKIQVAISLQIIGLFSEGLYSSPNKAVEELVSNAFDADATKVHVAVSRDRGASDATIAVIDNGTGMGVDGLKVHWIVGDSVKRQQRTTAGGRRSIGKFGIGKLAAYVLGNRLTHVSKHNGKYYSTSMDFSRIPQTASVDQLDGSLAPPVILDLRELDVREVREALGPWLDGDKEKSGIQLFGEGSEEHWTVAIISDLKSMATAVWGGAVRVVVALCVGGVYWFRRGGGGSGGTRPSAGGGHRHR